MLEETHPLGLCPVETTDSLGQDVTVNGERKAENGPHLDAHVRNRHTRVHNTEYGVPAGNPGPEPEGAKSRYQRPEVDVLTVAVLVQLIGLELGAAMSNEEETLVDASHQRMDGLTHECRGAGEQPDTGLGGRDGHVAQQSDMNQPPGIALTRTRTDSFLRRSSTATLKSTAL